MLGATHGAEEQLSQPHAAHSSMTTFYREATDAGFSLGLSMFCELT